MNKVGIIYNYVIEIAEQFEVNGLNGVSLTIGIDSSKPFDKELLTNSIGELFLSKLDMDAVREDSILFDLSIEINSIIEFITDSKSDTNHTIDKYETDYFTAKFIGIDVNLSELLSDNKGFKLERFDDNKFITVDDYVYTDDVEFEALSKENAVFSLSRPEKGYASYFFLYEVLSNGDTDVICSECILTPK